MLITKEKVLEIFRKKVLQNYSMDENAFGSHVQQWDEVSRHKAHAAIAELIEEGFIGHDAGWYKLLPKGVNFIKGK